MNECVCICVSVCAKILTSSFSFQVTKLCNLIQDCTIQYLISVNDSTTHLGTLYIHCQVLKSLFILQFKKLNFNKMSLQEAPKSRGFINFQFVNCTESMKLSDWLCSIFYFPAFTEAFI